MAKKQVILIMTDTQRRDMISIYNGKDDMHTPNLDSLAKDGIRFNKAYTCQPVCGPARSALFTGMYPHTNGMVANSMALNEHARTLGQQLNNTNVHSAYIGKWHLDGGDYFGNGICPDGWDKNYWYDMKNYLDEMSEADRFRSRKFETCFEDEGIEETFTYANKCTQKAIDFITKKKDEDFLLVVSYDEPHDPFLAPKEFFEAFKDGSHLNRDNKNMDISNLPDHIKVWAKQCEGNDGNPFGLLGCNSYVDYEMGKLLDHINDNVKDALIIYTSDHGDSLGSHNIIMKGPAMYDEITNIPLIMKWNNNIKENSVINDPTSHIDIVPTILDYFDIKKPGYLTGNSLIPVLKGCDSEKKPKAFIEFTRYEIDHDGFGGYQPIRCVVDNQYKLVINLMTQDELYDMENDPQEMNNLINNSDYIKIRNKLHDDLLKWMDDTRDPYRGYYWERRPWRTDVSEATWGCHGMTRQRYTREEEATQLDYSTGLEITELVRKK
ncbi:MAG: sulfatase-like hydrolase/transferase [Vallitalea sp.]|jgi:uncharacterized sulfatase|nr:sulfatase-like hydrolase/transferase [Vallitalea sp.]